MEERTGKKIFNGIAIGKIKFLEKTENQVIRTKVSDTAAEIERYEAAKIAAISQLEDLYEKALAEVGEANVVNLARECRENGWTVRILGEGSNGGNITHPGAVRDPLCTIFALIKLLVLRDEPSGGAPRKGLFHIWCELSGQTEKYRENFTLNDIIATLPAYTTTGVSEKRAILNIKTKDHSLLKGRFQKIFEQQWLLQKDKLKELYGFESYEAVITKGTKETRNVTDWSLSGKGGLKILFKDKNSNNLAFIWMRGSGTEPVFRVMCDVKGNKPKEEQRLLEWETQMLLKADNM